MLASLVALALALTVTAVRSVYMRRRFKNPFGAWMLIPVRFGYAALAWASIVLIDFDPAVARVDSELPLVVVVLAALALFESVGIWMHTEAPFDRPDEALLTEGDDAKWNSPNLPTEPREVQTSTSKL